MGYGLMSHNRQLCSVAEKKNWPIGYSSTQDELWKGFAHRLGLMAGLNMYTRFLKWQINSGEQFLGLLIHRPNQIRPSASGLLRSSTSEMRTLLKQMCLSIQLLYYNIG